MRLPSVPSLRELTRLYGLSAKSQLSQNFLLDLNLTNRIVRLCDRFGANLNSKVVVEIGPGIGSLTRSLWDVGNPRAIAALEKDMRFLPALEVLSQCTEGRIVPVMGDATKLSTSEVLQRCRDFHSDFHSISGGDEDGHSKASLFQMTLDPSWEAGSSPLFVVGNLPFNVATPLIVQMAFSMDKRDEYFAFGPTNMALMFQTEVADRIVAKPGSKAYGRLSVLLQSVCDTRHMALIPSKAFVPSPKVTGTMVYFAPKMKRLVGCTLKDIESLSTALFRERRKAVRNSLGKYLSISSRETVEKVLENAEVNAMHRPEHIEVSKYERLAREVKKFTG